MIKTIKIKLVPNNKQKSKMFQYAGVARFAYNWALNKEIENYKNGGKFMQDGELRKEFTKLRNSDGYEWLKDISNNVTKQAIKDTCTAYKNFFKGISNFPKFKTKKHSKLSFYQDTSKIKFTNTHVKLEGIAKSKKKNKQKLNWVRLAEHNRIPFGNNVKYYNPRVTFDGINWWISVGVETETLIEKSTNNGIGIDLGVKDLAICSDGNTYKNINKTKEVKRLEKKKRRLQRSVSRRYEYNKKGESYCKTCNTIKREKELLKLNHRLTNIRQNHIHRATSEIIKRKPSYICLEDLNVNDTMKNKHLSKAIQQQKLREFRRQIEYKAKHNNIQVVIANRFYPSSKTCNCCGKIRKGLKLSDRTYKCECGYINDRDINAALNLKDYGEKFATST